MNAPHYWSFVRSPPAIAWSPPWRRKKMLKVSPCHELLMYISCRYEYDDEVFREAMRNTNHIFQFGSMSLWMFFLPNLANFLKTIVSTVKPLILGAPNPKTEMFFILSSSCLCPSHWSHVLSREWRRSWNSADRRCSKYIWVIKFFIADWGALYVRGLTASLKQHIEAGTKGNHFADISVNENVWISIMVSLGLCLRSQVTIINIGSSDGLVPNKWQAIEQIMTLFPDTRSQWVKGFVPISLTVFTRNSNIDVCTRLHIPRQGCCRVIFSAITSLQVEWEQIQIPIDFES